MCLLVTWYQRLSYVKLLHLLSQPLMLSQDHPQSLKSPLNHRMVLIPCLSLILNQEEVLTLS